MNYYTRKKKISLRLLLTDSHLHSKPETGLLDTKCADETKLEGVAKHQNQLSANRHTKNEILVRKNANIYREKK